jgi:FCD domain
MRQPQTPHFHPERRKDYHEQHTAIVAVLTERDPERAHALMRDHLHHVSAECSDATRRRPWVCPERFEIVPGGGNVPNWPGSAARLGLARDIAGGQGFSISREGDQRGRDFLAEMRH